MFGDIVSGVSAENTKTTFIIKFHSVVLLIDMYEGLIISTLATCIRFSSIKMLIDFMSVKHSAVSYFLAGCCGCRSCSSHQFDFILIPIMSFDCEWVWEWGQEVTGD